MRREDDLHDAPELDAEDRALVDQLRTLSPEGREPDWNELEAAIRGRVGNRAASPWWRNWRWIVPVSAVTTAAVVALVVSRGSSDEDLQATTTTRVTTDDGGFTQPYREQANALWLDGEALELDDRSAPLLDELDSDARAIFEPDSDARAIFEPDSDATGGILPVTDYGWIDSLDDDAVAQAEHWLARKRT